MRLTRFEVLFPDYFDDYEPEIMAKGYFADLALEAGGRTFRPAFYDPVRLGQECTDRLRSGGACFSEPNLVVVEVVDREHILAALNWLAERGFDSLLPAED